MSDPVLAVCALVAAMVYGAVELGRWLERREWWR